MPDTNDGLEQPATAADIAALVMLMGSISSRLDEASTSVHRLEGLLSQVLAEFEALKPANDSETGDVAMPGARGFE